MIFSLTRPNYPNAAIGIERDSVSAISLQKQSRGQYGIKQAATTGLAAGVLLPSFLEYNLADADEFAAALESVVVSAGLVNQKRWSVTLPSSSARSAIITLETTPAGKAEAEEILDWKSEQTFGAPADQLRVARTKIAPNRDGKARYFATAISLAVVDEYESVFEKFGWKAGLILPRAVGESRWLLDRGETADSLLISEQQDGFTALLLRAGEPAVVRSVTCLNSEIDDEVYRLLMFYNDRFGESVEGSFLDRILLVGRKLVPEVVSKIAAESLGRSPRVLAAQDIGLNFPDETFNFDEIAAPAALASLA